MHVCGVKSAAGCTGVITSYTRSVDQFFVPSVRRLDERKLDERIFAFARRYGNEVMDIINTSLFMIYDIFNKGVMCKT